jgi:uracil-DNA glycosylase family 4
MQQPSDRLAYLQALGIDVWVPRTAAASAPPALPSLPAAVALPLAPASRLDSPERWEELWQSLQSEVAGCTKCALATTRTQTVFGVGNPHADWLVIGEAPGAEEDRQGKPFVGAAGKLLDAMLQAIDLSRDRNVFILNMLKCRPPHNRDPKPEELDACLPYLMRQVAAIKPKLILAVGRIAAQNLLATDSSLARLRGRVHQFGPLCTPLIVTYHPAYLLRTPADKRKAWEDLKFARDYFKNLTTSES